MKKAGLIRMLVWLLLAVTLSCTRAELPHEEGAELCITVRFPDVVRSKADVSPEDAETSMKKENFRIWVFLAEEAGGKAAGTCLGYISPYQHVYYQTASEDRFFLRISKEIALAKPRVNVYVLANNGSLPNMPGKTWNANTQQANLDSYLFDGNYYGVQADGSPTHLLGRTWLTGTSLDASSLPYSAVAKNLPMNGDYPSMTVETVTLRRMVTKFRIAMSQLTDAVGPVVQFQIKELSLDGNLIPVSEYVFNDSAYPYKISGGYLSQELIFPIPATVASNTHPQDYALAVGDKPQTFETRILEGISSGEVTDVGACYLRETDKPLSGRIVYSVMGGADQEKTFELPSGVSFSRNHSWLVYIYFLSTEMDFQVSWTPWQEGQTFEVR